MISYECSRSITEVLDILEHTNKNDVDKISPTFMRFLKDNALKEYNVNLDHSKRIKDMNLSEMTIGILAIINRKFWCTDEQKEEFDAILKNNELKYQEQFREKYNPDNIFKHNEYSTCKETAKAEEKSLVEYKETFFMKLKKNILKLLHIKI